MKGMVYAHEHLCIDLSGPKGDDDCRLDDRALTLRGLRALVAAGADTVLDQTARGMGRDIPYAVGLAEEAGICVRFATGFYKEPFLPAECYTLDERGMCALFLSELRDGMDGTGVRAAHIGEIGTGKDAIAPIEAQIFRAASAAHRESGAAICTHTTLGLLGAEQVAIFRDCGVDLTRVVLSHIDLSGDLDYMLRLLDTGVNIAFDTIGKDNYFPDAGRVELLSALCGRGYHGQIVLSLDLTRKSNCRALGYDYLPRVFLPLLTERGVSGAHIAAMTTENPRRIYQF